MQQLLAAFGINWQLLLAQAVNFGIVLGALWYLLYKPVLKILEERRQVVAKGVEDARRASEQLEGADAEAATRLNKADAQADELLAHARQAATAEGAQLVDAARARAEALQKDAAARAAEEAAKAKRESEREIARLALLAAEKVLAQKHAAGGAAKHA